MRNELSLPKTLREAIIYFSDLDRCIAYAIKLRWNNGAITCPRCASTKHSYISTRRLWFCKGCKKQFTIKVGSVMEDSPISLGKWMTAAWLICNCKSGISSYEIARDLGLTQKTAWFLDHRIRAAMLSDSLDKLPSEIEADEGFGGKARNMHRKRVTGIAGSGGRDKHGLMGIPEHVGKVKNKVIPKGEKSIPRSEIRKHVEANSALLSDRQAREKCNASPVA